MIAYFPLMVRWLLAAIVVLTPLVFWHGVFFPFTFTKTILFYTLVELACVLWIPFALTSPTYRLRMSGIGISVILFFGVLVLASATGVNWSHSLWSDIERMMGLFTFFHLVLFFLMISSFVRDSNYRNLLFQLSFGTSVLVALIGMFQIDPAAVRVESTVGNAAFLATYLLVHVFVGLMLLLEHRRFDWKSCMYAVGVFLVVTTLIFTETRAGVLGLIAGAGALGVLFLLFANPNVLLKRVTFGILAGGLVALALVFTFQERLISYAPDALDRYLSIDLKERTVEGRFLIWQVMWEGLKERPFLGWGMDNQNILVDRHYDARLYALEPWIDRAHNVVLDIGAMAGFAGILAYAAMIILALWALYKKWRSGVFSFWVAASLVSILVSYVVQNAFTFDTPLSYIIFFMILGIISGAEEQGRPVGKVPQWNKTAAAAFGAVLLFMLPIWHVGAWKPWRANAAALAGWTTLARGEGDLQAIELFEKALSYDTYGSIDFRRMFAEYIFEFLKQGGQRPDESLRRLMDYGLKVMDENIKEAPENVKWWMYLGELYNLMTVKFDPSLAVKTEEFYIQALTLSQERPQIYLELAQTLKTQGDIEGMWQVLDKLKSIVPDDYEAMHLNAAVHAIEVKNLEREQREVAWLTQRGRGDAELRDAYFRVKRYADAIKFQNRLIEKQERRSGAEALKRSEHFTLYAHLAALYQYAGDSPKAKDAALEALSLDSSRRPEVQAFLESIGY